MSLSMAEVQLAREQKGYLGARWHQNETNYLRECRQKDVSELKTIGHGKLPFSFPSFAQPSSFFSSALGAFGVVSLVREMSTGK